MIRPRFITGLLLAIALVAIPAMAAAATLNVTGTTSGTATAQAPTADASCDPQSPAVPADFICDFDIAETFTLTELGTGTYTGSTRLDWSIYTGSEPCAELTGTTTLANTEGTISISILDTSRVCETASPDQHTFEADATVVSGTGAYAGATGAFTGIGTLDAHPTPGVYDTTQALTGTITVPDPTPTPTPSASATVSAGPTSTPSVGLLPDTSSPGANTASLAVAMAGLLLASAAYGGFRARSRA